MATTSNNRKPFSEALVAYNAALKAASGPGAANYTVSSASLRVAGDDLVAKTGWTVRELMDEQRRLAVDGQECACKGGPANPHCASMCPRFKTRVVASNVTVMMPPDKFR